MKKKVKITTDKNVIKYLFLIYIMLPISLIPYSMVFTFINCCRLIFNVYKLYVYYIL